MHIKHLQQYTCACMRLWKLGLWLLHTRHRSSIRDVTVLCPAKQRKAEAEKALPDIPQSTSTQAGCECHICPRNECSMDGYRRPL